MTETSWKDIVLHLEAENAKLRAELRAKTDVSDTAIRMLQRELAALRQQAEAAAPTDAEIEAWRVMWAKRIRVGLEMGEDDALLYEAVAKLRAHRPAPAQIALREAAECAAEWLETTTPQLVQNWLDKWNHHPQVYVEDEDAEFVRAKLRDALAAEPPAPSALREAAKRARERYREWERIPGAGVRDDISRDNFIEAACKLMEACESLTAEPPVPSAAAGVAVPEDVRAAAEKLDSGDASLNDQARCASFILSLAAAVGASQPEPGIRWRGINRPGVDGGLIVERDDGARLRWVGVDGVDNTDGNRMPLSITLELKRGDVVLNTETYRPTASQPEPAAQQQPQADGPKPVSDEWERGWNAHVKHASTQQPQAAEPKETKCWPLIKLNTLCVRRLAQWGFTNANPFREEDERQVIDACREKQEATCPHPGIRDAPTSAQPDAELQRLLDEAKRVTPWMSPNEKCILAVVEALARKAGAK